MPVFRPTGRETVSMNAVSSRRFSRFVALYLVTVQFAVKNEVVVADGINVIISQELQELSFYVEV